MAKQIKGDFHRIPGGNRIALSDELAQEIWGRADKVRKHRFQLFLLAAGLRRKYLNKKTQEYPATFRKWYDKHKLDNVFGSLSNFTKYASAGDVVDYTAGKTRTPEKYLKQLPTSVGALYEISLMLKVRHTKRDEDGQNMFVRCLHGAETRDFVGQPPRDWKGKSKPALIRPNSTEAEIRTYKRNWGNPPPKRPKRTDKRTLGFLTITVSGELFDFDRKTGDKTGCVNLDEVEAMFAKINKLFTDKNAAQFGLAETLVVKPGTKGKVLQPAMQYLTEGYFKRQKEADPASGI